MIAGDPPVCGGTVCLILYFFPWRSTEIDCTSQLYLLLLSFRSTFKASSFLIIPLPCFTLSSNYPSQFISSFSRYSIPYPTSPTPLLLYNPVSNLPDSREYQRKWTLSSPRSCIDVLLEIVPGQFRRLPTSLLLRSSPCFSEYVPAYPIEFGLNHDKPLESFANAILVDYLSRNSRDGVCRWSSTGRQRSSPNGFVRLA